LKKKIQIYPPAGHCGVDRSKGLYYPLGLLLATFIMCRYCIHLPKGVITEQRWVYGETRLDQFLVLRTTRYTDELWLPWCARDMCLHYKNSLQHIRISFGDIDGNYDPTNNDCIMIHQGYYDFTHSYWDPDMLDEINKRIMRGKMNDTRE